MLVLLSKRSPIISSSVQLLRPVVRLLASDSVVAHHPERILKHFKNSRFK